MEMNYPKVKYYHKVKVKTKHMGINQLDKNKKLCNFLQGFPGHF